MNQQSADDLRLDGRSILSDTWYGTELAADSAGRIRGRASRWLITVRMALRSGRYDVILTSQGNRTIPGLIALAGWLRLTRRRKLVLTEFLPGTRRRGVRGAVVTIAYRLLLDRVCLGIQVMTAWEVEAYANRYRIAPQRLVHVPFYWFDDRVLTAPAPPEQRSIIMSSGRNSCDWPTLIAALGDRDDLVIVCSTADLPTVSTLAGKNVTVRCDIPRTEHDDLLAHARLLILALEDNDRSAGHVRLLGAATLGTPVVATGVRGIEGYDQLAVAVVPPADPQALRAEVERLLADTETLTAKADAVRTLARTRTRSDYIRDIATMLLPAGPARGAAAASAPVVLLPERMSPPRVDGSGADIAGDQIRDRRDSAYSAGGRPVRGWEIA
ncbi:MAG: glycosyltransferase [Nakamurella sp.]